jgi:hypothetical protein
MTIALGSQKDNATKDYATAWTALGDQIIVWRDYSSSRGLLVMVRRGFSRAVYYLADIFYALAGGKVPRWSEASSFTFASFSHGGYTGSAKGSTDEFQATQRRKESGGDAYERIIVDHDWWGVIFSYGNTSSSGGAPSYPFERSMTLNELIGWLL